MGTSHVLPLPHEYEQRFVPLLLLQPPEPLFEHFSAGPGSQLWIDGSHGGIGGGGAGGGWHGGAGAGYSPKGSMMSVGSSFA
jgi:uncharacterized membrane protein